MNTGIQFIHQKQRCLKNNSSGTFFDNMRTKAAKTLSGKMIPASAFFVFDRNESCWKSSKGAVGIRSNFISFF